VLRGDAATGADALHHKRHTGAPSILRAKFHGQIRWRRTFGSTFRAEEPVRHASRAGTAKNEAVSAARHTSPFHLRGDKQQKDDNIKGHMRGKGHGQRSYRLLLCTGQPAG